jgi:hypothetical protein
MHQPLDTSVVLRLLTFDRQLARQEGMRLLG